MELMSVPIIKSKLDIHHTTEITLDESSSFYLMIATSPVEEVPGSSPGLSDILFKPKVYKKPSAIPKLGS